MRKRYVAFRMIASLAALLLAGGTLALAAPAAAMRPHPAVATDTNRCAGGLYQVHTVRKHHSSRLVAVDPDTGRNRWSTGLDHTVKAVGYDVTQHLFIGVATRRKGHPIGDGGHIVTITPAGETRDLGPVRADSVPVAGAYAAAIVDGHLLLLLDGDLVAVDVRPGSATFLRVVRRTALPRLPSFGDWDIRPGGSALYAVSTEGRGPSRLVRVDLATGAVTEQPVKDLPGRGFFGAVAFDDAGRYLYATDNHDGGALYRITVDGAATRLTSGRGLLGSDAAWCRAVPRPPATTKPPASPTPKSAPASTPPRPQAVAPPPVPRPPIRPPATTPPPPPSPTPVAVVDAARKRHAVAEPRRDYRTTTVRFGIVLLVLGLGGAAFAKPVTRIGRR
ncbi:hypothetical protein K1W54_23065 [Micromonospora sp. CPCC 205371]|nr:hypothetical protein [Micromonospora sp. CPCC 205371]